MSQKQLDEEIDQINDIELKSTMWKVLRSKKALNNVLVNYEVSPDMSTHKIGINDVIKFGRVNFKVCALRCENRLHDEVQGGLHLLEKKNLDVV